MDPTHTLRMVSLPCPPPKALQGQPRAWGSKFNQRKAENCCPLLTVLRGMCGCSEACVDLQSASTGALLSSGDLPLADALLASLLGSSPKKNTEGKNTWRKLSAHMGCPQSASSPSSASTSSALWPMDFQARCKLRQLPLPRHGSCEFGLQLPPAAALHGTSSCPRRSAAGSEGWPAQHTPPQHEVALF